MRESITRRDLFKYGFTASLLIAFFRIPESYGNVVCSKPSDKIKDKILDPNSAVSKRLDYVESMEKDFSHKAFKAGADCGNCRFYQTARKEADWAPCTMAANKYVPSCGWCKSHALDPKKKG